MSSIITLIDRIVSFVTMIPILSIVRRVKCSPVTLMRALSTPVPSPDEINKSMEKVEKYKKFLKATCN